MVKTTGYFYAVPSGLILFLLLLVGNAFAQSPSTKHNLLFRIESASYAPTFSVVAARLREGKDIEAKYRQLDTLLARPYGDMFWMYGCAGLYYATQDVLRPSYKERIRWCWKHFTPYRGDTENHFLMYYGSLLLMSQAWPDLPDIEWFMGKSSKEIYAESKEYLDHWIDETVRYGQTEWSSPRYGYYYITPLILLAEYTKDLRMKHRFEMMLEYVLADYAQDYLNGNYCGAHSRVSDEGAIDPRNSEIASYGEYFFGDTITHLQPDVAFAALTSFRCPKIIRQIATDRSEPYESFSLKRGRQMIRYMDKWSASDSSYDSTFHAPVYKYEYMTKDYCLGSMQGGIVQPIQQQSWSLVFNSDKPHNIVTGLHPYVSAEELGMFFPEYPSFMLERIGSTKKGYTNENKWVGGSPYEHIYQDKNVLVALYDLPDSVKYHHVDLFIPDSAVYVKDTSHPTSFHGHRGTDANMYSYKPGYMRDYESPEWQTYQFDSVLIGVFPMSRFASYQIAEGTRLQMPLETEGFVVMCESSRTISPLAFKYKLNSLRLSQTKDRIVSQSDNGATINISLRQQSSDWLFKSPYLESKKGSGVLTLHYKGEKRVLDFRE